MGKIRHHQINDQNYFIQGYYLENPAICDEIISYHKKSNTYQGECTKGIDLTIKNSKDCHLDINSDLYPRFINIELQKCLELYIKRFPFVNGFDPWTIKEKVMVQYYELGGGFYNWHTERDSLVFPICARHLVFMTYLNDVNVGGETEFFHQNLKIKPEKSLTLFWPADWTHTHRGIPSNEEEKYIVTGWYSYDSP